MNLEFHKFVAILQSEQLKFSIKNFFNTNIT